MPIDPKDLVTNWVKTVDSVTSELQNESKIFGDDQEFYHVQRDPSEVPGFRDSGYYDGVLDSKISLDTKSGLSALERTLSDKINHGKGEEIRDPSSITDYLRAKPIKTKYPIEQNQAEKLFKVPIGTAKDQPVFLPAEVPADLREINNDVDVDNLAGTPSSIGPGNSSSDSEYQSGQEDLSSNLNSPSTPRTDNVMESSVDTGEVFQPETATDPSNDPNKAAENCIVS